MRDQDVQDLAAGNVAGELKEKALTEVACSDARRVELLHDLERLFGLGKIGVAPEVANHVGQLEVEVTIIIEVENNIFGQRTDGRIGIEKRKLV